LFFFAFGVVKVAKNGITFVGTAVMYTSVVLRVQILALEGST
jgi:hypothetical protein